jgi:hypothetical protein
VFILEPRDCFINVHNRCGSSSVIDTVYVDIGDSPGTNTPVKRYRGSARIAEFRLSYSVKCGSGFFGDHCTGKL